MLPDAAYWSRMCQAMEVDDLIEDERFADSRSRYKNMAVLIGLIDEALAKRSRDEWGKIFDKAGLIWGPVLALHEVPQDPHAIELGMFPSVEHPEMGSYRTVNIPMRFATATQSNGIHGAPGSAGAQTAGQPHAVSWCVLTQQ